MVTHRLALAALALLLLSCVPAGKTCGRGRCQTGACLNVISTYSTMQELSLEWWCVVPCDTAVNCPQDLCLQSAIDSTLSACAGNQLEIHYRYDGKSFRTAQGTATLTSFEIAPAGRTPITCMPNQSCEAGWFSSGEMLPLLTGTSTTGSTLELFNGSPGETLSPADSAGEAGNRAPLGPLLPTGIPIIINIGGPIETLF